MAAARRLSHSAMSVSEPATRKRPVAVSRTPLPSFVRSCIPSTRWSSRNCAETADGE
ncbi:hypothetical protein D3C85_1664090 [compost metagenome]